MKNVSVVTNIVKVHSNDKAEIGTHNVPIDITLSYKGVVIASASTSIKIVITECVLTSFTMSLFSPNKIQYKILESGLVTIALPTTSQIPALCDFYVSQEFTISGIQLPYKGMTIQDNKFLSIETLDLSQRNKDFSVNMKVRIDK